MTFRRHSNQTVLLFVGICGAALWAAASTPPACAFDVGTAAVKITPPPGTPMAGYYHRRDSTGALDDLYAKAVVLSDGKTKVAMVVCDVIGMPRGIALEARKLAAAETQIPAAHIMISATHTHTAPVIIGFSTRDASATGGSQLSINYAGQLPRWIAQAVAAANGQLTPATVSFGSETESGLSFIRRFWMKNGTVGWNPGKLNPNIIRPIGVIDPQVNVFCATSAAKKPLLTYVNFAMHPDTTGGDLISADYPGALARRLAEWRGPDMLTIFANGPCGNINHVDVKSGERQHGPEEANRIGTVLAGAVIKACMHTQPITDCTLQARCEVVELPLPQFTAEELEWSQKIVAQPKGVPFLDQVKAFKIADVAARRGKPYDVDVQVFTLGHDIAWVALPGEVFVELGLSIKAASPFPQTNVVELANGTPFYIPNRSAFAEGQYEVVSTRYAAGAGELLVTTAIRLLNELEKAAGHTIPAKATAAK